MDTAREKNREKKKEKKKGFLFQICVNSFQICFSLHWFKSCFMNTKQIQRWKAPMKATLRVQHVPTDPRAGGEQRCLCRKTPQGVTPLVVYCSTKVLVCAFVRLSAWILQWVLKTWTAFHALSVAEDLAVTAFPVVMATDLARMSNYSAIGGFAKFLLCKARTRHRTSREATHVEAVIKLWWPGHNPRREPRLADTRPGGRNMRTKSLPQVRPGDDRRTCCQHRTGESTSYLHAGEREDNCPRTSSAGWSKSSNSLWLSPRKLVSLVCCSHTARQSLW